MRSSDFVPERRSTAAASTSPVTLSVISTSAPAAPTND
jgi:hypothetical protein